jgi:L-ascorbate metabolism protein UlaG (beta-lactamase superfamily)
MYLFSLFFGNAADGQKPFSRTHYFYNSGWLLETDQHILVFDFIPHASSNISLAGLKKQIIQNKNNKEVLVFISHSHQDHYNDSIFNLASDIKVTFLLGWNPDKKPLAKDLHIIVSGDSLVSKNYTVYTHSSTDEGSGFLVNINGLTIYHAGDHALWSETQLPEFTAELKYIRSKAASVDIAFLPAARGMFVKCVYDSIIGKGLQESAEILKPKTIALQHIGCSDKLHQYKQARERLSKIRSNWIIPEKYDQGF